VVPRPEALRERLLKLEEVVSRLEEIGPVDSAVLRLSFRDAWAAERGLQIAAEAIFDIGNHVLSAHFGVSSKDYEDIVPQLAAHGVISDELRLRLKGLGGFRNILVHGYLRIDADRVSAHLSSAPEVFSEFAREVRQWMARTVTSGA
jgi:uncharacterized protein YutE (UPF0331/DUF86 family)